MMCFHTRFIPIVLSALFLSSLSYADQRQHPQSSEDPACHPMTAANEHLAKLRAYQTTWDATIRTSGRLVMHRETVQDSGFEYVRSGPYALWRRQPNVIINPQRSDCHRLHEELLDGVKTLVISYVKHNPDYDARFYRCTLWLESVRSGGYRGIKSDCVSILPDETVEIKIHWFYRTDIKPPVPR
jgi:hypothetical protein